LIIHANFSYPSIPPWGPWGLFSFFPDPFFRVYIPYVHKDKHGSDSGTYDNEGRYLPQKFEDIFAKYAGTDGKGKDAITFWEILNMMKGQRVIMDPIGWFGAFFECE
jgi:peroxygenase